MASQAAYSDHVQRDLLDALLRAKCSAENNNTAEINAEPVGLTDDHLLMTMGDIFGAGVETSTTVMKWAIAYLIHYPEVRAAPWCSLRSLRLPLSVFQDSQTGRDLR